MHGFYPELEGGDLLIVAGDLTADDKTYQYLEFGLWLSRQCYKYKVLVAGNHDNKMREWPSMFENLDNFKYLSDSGTEFDGLKIWGSPWTQWFHGVHPSCKAFMLTSEEKLKKKWALIPNDVDILVTHSPPAGMMDICIDGRRVGSPGLTRYAANYGSTLKLHVFGHIHESYGTYDLRKIQKQLGDETTSVFVNASHVNERYEPVNKPVRVVI